MIAWWIHQFDIYQIENTKERNKQKKKLNNVLRT
jgi:hypothetical protein